MTRRMTATRCLLGALCLAASGGAVAAVDALATLNDDAVMKQVQQDIAKLPRAELTPWPRPWPAARR